MGLLNELKKEAQSVKLKEARDRASAKDHSKALQKRLETTTRTLYEYLKEFCDNLKVVAPDIRYAYEVKFHGELADLKQGAYRVTTPDTRALDHFTLHFVCQSEGGVKIQVQGKEAGDQQREYLWNHNLRFTWKFGADGVGVFNLENHVPVTLEFRANLERGGLVLTARNFEYLGTNRVFLTPDQIDDEFMEEFAKCIMRKESRFNELCGNTLTSEMRERLRSKLQGGGTGELEREKRAVPPPPKKRKGLFGFVEARRSRD